MLFLLFDSPSQVTSTVQLAAFAIAGLVSVVALIVRRLKGRLPHATLWVLTIGGLAIFPFLTHLVIDLAKPTYRIRVTLVNLSGFPVDGTVTSSLGGEIKKVNGGWEIDVPNDSKPGDGKLIIFGQANNPLTGKTELFLADDHNPSVTLVLGPPHDQTSPQTQIPNDNIKSTKGLIPGRLKAQEEMATVSMKQPVLQAPSHQTQVEPQQPEGELLSVKQPALQSSPQKSPMEPEQPLTHHLPMTAPLPPAFRLQVGRGGSTVVQQLLGEVVKCAPAALDEVASAKIVSGNDPNIISLECTRSCYDTKPISVDLALVGKDGFKLWGYTVVFKKSADIPAMAQDVCNSYGGLRFNKDSIIVALKEKGDAQ